MTWWEWLIAAVGWLAGMGLWFFLGPFRRDFWR